ncbi:MAG TPA: hypothetical protein VGK25_02570 [Ignavibacteria bacterium]|jgi:hypothetical protein
MYWLLEQPLFISFTVLCLITISISLGGLWFIRRKFPHEKIKDNHDTASVIFNAYGLLYAVVVAFVFFITWNSYDKATMDAEMEANALMDLFYISDSYPDSVRKEIGTKIIDYVNEIAYNEWKMHAGGEISQTAADKMGAVWNAILGANSSFKPGENIYSSAFETMRTITESRRLRIFAVKQTVPSIVWTVLIIGSVLFISSTYFFSMKNAAPQFLITACFTILITLMLYLIYVLDHAFTGTSAISNEPFKLILEIMKSHSR